MKSRRRILSQKPAVSLPPKIVSIFIPEWLAAKALRE